MENKPPAIKYKKQVVITRHICKEKDLEYLKKNTPNIAEIAVAESIESGIDVNGLSIPIPPMNTTASNPSLNDVTKGNINKEYFSPKVFARLSPYSLDNSLSEYIIEASFTLNFSLNFPILKKNRPITDMITDAITLKTPS